VDEKEFRKRCVGRGRRRGRAGGVHVDAMVRPASVGGIGGIKGECSSILVDVVIKSFSRKPFGIGVTSGVEVSMGIS